MSPTAALNRKFDLLAKSGTCSTYLLDVLTLLVAHANDTELFKRELRSAPFDNNIPPRATDSRALAVVQPVDSTELEKVCLRAQEDVLLAAETSLHTYATDMKMLNDIALATSSKALRQMKEKTSADMVAFRDNVVCETVNQTRNELDSLRIGWLESLDGEVTQLKKDLHQMQLVTQKELHNMTEAFGDYMERGFGLLHAEPLLDAHRAMGESSLCAERLTVLERQHLTTRADVDALCNRLGAVERAVAQLGNRGASPNASPPPDDPLASAASATMSQRQVQHTQRGPQPTHGTPPLTTSGADAPRLTPLGLNLRDGGDQVEGIIVTDVVTDSLADKVKITPGCIISHVGRVTVCTCSEFAKEVNLAGSVVKLTVYDPENAKVSIVTINR